MNEFAPILISCYIAAPAVQVLADMKKQIAAVFFSIFILARNLLAKVSGLLKKLSDVLGFGLIDLPTSYHGLEEGTQLLSHLCRHQVFLLDWPSAFNRLIIVYVVQLHRVRNDNYREL